MVTFEDLSWWPWIVGAGYAFAATPVAGTLWKRKTFVSSPVAWIGGGGTTLAILIGLTEALGDGLLRNRDGGEIVIWLLVFFVTCLATTIASMFASAVIFEQIDRRRRAVTKE